MPVGAVARLREPPRQREVDVTAVLAERGQPLLRQLALDRKRSPRLGRDQAERLGLKGVRVNQVGYFNWLALADPCYVETGPTLSWQYPRN